MSGGKVGFFPSGDCESLRRYTNQQQNQKNEKTCVREKERSFQKKKIETFSLNTQYVQKCSNSMKEPKGKKQRTKSNMQYAEQKQWHKSE
jgi:hypothetical protein